MGSLAQSLDLSAFGKVSTSTKTVTTKATVSELVPDYRKVDRRGFKTGSAPVTKSPTGTREHQLLEAAGTCLRVVSDALQVLPAQEVTYHLPPETARGLDLTNGTEAPAKPVRKDLRQGLVTKPTVKAVTTSVSEHSIHVGVVNGPAGEVGMVLPMIRFPDTGYHLTNKVTWDGKNQTLAVDAGAIRSLHVLVITKTPGRPVEMRLTAAYVAARWLMLPSRDSKAGKAPVSSSITGDGEVITDQDKIRNLVHLPHKVVADMTAVFGTNPLYSPVAEWTETYARCSHKPGWAFMEVLGRPYLFDNSLRLIEGVMDMFRDAKRDAEAHGLIDLPGYRDICKALGAPAPAMPTRSPRQQPARPERPYQGAAPARQARSYVHA